MTGDELRKLAASGGVVYTVTTQASKFTQERTQHFKTEHQRDNFILQLLRHGDCATATGTKPAADCLSLLTKDFLV